jgi:hypothetical protein
VARHLIQPNDSRPTDITDSVKVAAVSGRGGLPDPGADILIYVGRQHLGAARNRWQRGAGRCDEDLDSLAVPNPRCCVRKSSVVRWRRSRQPPPRRGVFLGDREKSGAAQVPLKPRPRLSLKFNQSHVFLEPHLANGIPWTYALPKGGDRPGRLVLSPDHYRGRQIKWHTHTP